MRGERFLQLGLKADDRGRRQPCSIRILKHQTRYGDLTIRTQEVWRLLGTRLALRRSMAMIPLLMTKKYLPNLFIQPRKSRIVAKWKMRMRHQHQSQNNNNDKMMTVAWIFLRSLDLNVRKKRRNDLQRAEIGQMGFPFAIIVWTIPKS
jgi:hypothetical protein